MDQGFCIKSGLIFIYICVNMINIDSVYQTVARLLRKNQQGKLVPSEFNKYAQMANNSRFNQLYGRPEDFRPGRAQATIAYPEARQIDERLSVFVVSAPVTIDVTTGRFPKPGGLLRMDSIIHVTASVSNPTIVPVKYRAKNTRGRMFSSVIMPPDDEHPIYFDFGTYYYVLPINISNVNITYLKKPPVVKWAYIPDANGRPVYDSGNSVNFLWDDSEEPTIVALILQYASVSVQDQQALGFAVQKEVKGQ